jgi:diaminopimelate epimerase
MKFTKMHGIGNDYVYVDCVTAPLESQTMLTPERLAELVSDRHFGIGSDGLILIKPSLTADFTMEMYNADGSRGAMCGNGIRCVAKYVYDHGLTNMTTLRIETLAGVKTIDLTVRDHKVTMAKVSMGIPILTSNGVGLTLGQCERQEREDGIYLTEGEISVPLWEHLTVEKAGVETIDTIGISMGNPHTILFYDSMAEAPVVTLGPAIEKLPRFADRTNVEFIVVDSRNQIEMRVWERGSGETLACGTGACAAAVAAMLAGYVDRNVTVKLTGGSLMIYWNPETGEVEMMGPATEVFSGEIAL